MSQKVEVGGTGRDIKGGNALIGGTAYAIKKGRTLIGGTGYDISRSSAAPISELPVGSIVKIAVDGTLREFLVVQQGLPGSIYDSSCDGTWLLMKDCYVNMKYRNTDSNPYQDSNLHSYLNGDFLNLLESDIQSLIKQVKIPYFRGYDFYGKVDVGAGELGLSAKAFVLSTAEINWHANYTYDDGSALSYFAGANTTASDPTRIAYKDGAETYWWTRSPYKPQKTSSQQSWLVSTDGALFATYVHATGGAGVRPAFILPSDTLVSDDGTIVV